ncbi:FAD:protein FMN transferase [Pseudogulbenkiania sp. NH8B]|uniref:FAD:protein FMN transferase n=1 Tax=Pseudogulbenkiania sp. (strain NH8B) TaxID=748280 RepID=UPI0018E06632|nr:FAD:protein FMN transferase [Pseudogulbenkiania sp. NH8B]
MSWLSLRPPAVFAQGDSVFGTQVQLVLAEVSADQARVETNAVFGLFDQMHKQLHAWQPSEVMRLNAAIAAGQPFQASPRLAAILREARALSMASGGLFDPGISHLVKLWGFEADQFDGRQPPVAAEIETWRQRQPSLADLDIAANGVVNSRNRAVMVDLGGFAKGWALDEAAALLKSHGVRNALIDVGGNLMALGDKEGEAWTVGLQHPRRAGMLGSIALHCIALHCIALRDGEAIGTSGDYYRYFRAGGVRYCHIIDPHTGYPAQASQSVTVLADPAPHAGALSDGASKAPFITGPGEAGRQARASGVNKLLLVDAAGQVWATHQMAARIHWRQPKPVVHLLVLPTKAE